MHAPPARPQEAMYNEMAGAGPKEATEEDSILAALEQDLGQQDAYAERRARAGAVQMNQDDADLLAAMELEGDMHSVELEDTGAAPDPAPAPERAARPAPPAPKSMGVPDNRGSRTYSIEVLKAQVQMCDAKISQVGSGAAAMSKADMAQLVARRKSLLLKVGARQQEITANMPHSLVAYVDGLKQEMEALYARIRRLQEQRKKADAKQLAATYKIMQAEEKALSNHIANLEPAYMPDTLAGPVDPVSSIEVTPDEMAGELNVRRPPVARALRPSPLAPRPSAPHPSPRTHHPAP